MLKIDNDTLRARVANVEAELGGQDLQGLVLYANGSVLGNRSITHGYLRYLCDFDGHNTPAMMVLRPHLEPILITGAKPHMRTQTAEKALWFQDVRHVAPHLFGKEIVSILAGHGAQARRFAYVGFSETLAPVWKSIEGGLPEVDWVHDFAPHIDKYRVQKNPVEMSFHRRAAQICDAIFETVALEVNKGRKGYQIQAAMEYTARYEGCDYCITWLTISPQADAPRFYKEECLRSPQTGDQILAGIYLMFDGHWGHAIRTGSVGSPSDKHRGVYDVCREMQNAALERLCPGEDLHEVNAAMDRALHKHYTDDEVHRSRAGHGLGYSYEDPIVSLAFPNSWDIKDQTERKHNAIPIKPGMLLELHPHLFVPGVGGAMIGDMVAVTDTGYEILTEFTRDLITWRC